MRRERVRAERSHDAAIPQTAERAAPAVGRLHDLQRFAGNTAVATFLQRQGGGTTTAAPTSVDNPLDTAAVSDALSYYRRQPWLYTREVITDLRTRLGLDPAGGIDAELAQAVARFQRDEGSNDPALRIDGKAGPRSTPRLFPTGLAAAGEGAQFGGEAQTDVFDEWDTLATAQARADALVATVNRRLAAAGVPAVTAVLYNGATPDEQGSFDFGTWAMMLNRLLLDQTGLTRDDAASLAETVYHEARHTEQWFWMARLRAGQGFSAAGIASGLGIPAAVATAAKAAPIRRGSTEAVVASGWFESVYGAESAHREDVLTRLDTASWALTTAECRCQRAPSPANDALLVRAQERFDRVHDEYRELPEENDAWATGPMAQAGVTGGTPNPVPTPTVDPCEQLRRAGRPVPAAAPAPTGGAGP